MSAPLIEKFEQLVEASIARHLKATHELDKARAEYAKPWTARPGREWRVAHRLESATKAHATAFEEKLTLSLVLESIRALYEKRQITSLRSAEDVRAYFGGSLGLYESQWWKEFSRS